MILRKLKSLKLLITLNSFYNHKVYSRAMVAFAGIFFIIFLSPFFIDLERYKPEIENQIQEKFFIKAKINENITYKPLIRPHIELFSVDIFETNKKEDVYIGNIYKVNLRINIFDIILRKFNITDVEVNDGIIEIENNYFDNFFKNVDSIKSLKVIKVNNLDLKYSSNKNSIEISDINSDIIFDNGSFKRFNLKGVNGIAPIVEVNVNKEGEFISGNVISIKQIGEGIPIIDKDQNVLIEIKKLIASDFPESKIVFNESSFTKVE